MTTPYFIITSDYYEKIKNMIYTRILLLRNNYRYVLLVLINYIFITIFGKFYEKNDEIYLLPVSYKFIYTSLLF